MHFLSVTYPHAQAAHMIHKFLPTCFAPLAAAAELTEGLLATPLFLPSPLIGEQDPLLPSWVTKLTDIAMCCCCRWARNLLNRCAGSRAPW
jgi:hypothetical protein